MLRPPTKLITSCRSELITQSPDDELPSISSRQFAVVLEIQASNFLQMLIVATGQFQSANPAQHKSAKSGQSHRRLHLDRLTDTKKGVFSRVAGSCVWSNLVIT